LREIREDIMAISISSDCVIVERIKVHTLQELSDLIGGENMAVDTVEYKDKNYRLITDAEGEDKGLVANELMFNKFGKIVYGPALFLSGRELRLIG
jgi:hypothetical protein